MDQAPPPADEAHRLGHLRALEMLDTAPDPALDALVRSAARITDCPIALLCLIDAQRLWFKARVGVDLREVPRDNAPCVAALQSGSLFEVSDLQADPRFGGSSLAAGAPHARSYAGMAIEVSGMRIGTLCVMDTRPRSLTAAQCEGLLDLALATQDLIAAQQRSAQLDASQRRWLDFANASGDWLWETDAEHRCVWLSSTFEVFTGVSISEQIGRLPPQAEVLDWNGARSPGKRSFLDLLRNHTSFARAVVRRATRQGTQYVSYSAQTVLGAGGEFKGYRGVARDLTRRIEGELRDRQTFETLQNLAQHVPGVIYQFERRADGSASFPYASEGLRRVFELSPEQVLHDAAPWFERIHPEDRDAVRRAIDTSAKSAQSWSQTWRVQLPGQGVRVLDNVASPNNLPDGAVMWHGFVTDVTEQQKVAAELTRSGEQWALASHAASIGIFEFDPSASTVRLDQHACALHGLPMAGNGAVGKTLVFAQWLDLLNADSREVAKAYLATVSAASVAQREVLLSAPPGAEPRSLEFVVRALPGTARHSARVLMGVCRDVTEQVAVELLHQQITDAQQASRSKTEFLSRVSHELRTPLNGILGFAQLLESDPGEPLSHTQLQRVQTIRMSGSRLLSLVNDVLELSKIEQKTFAFQVESVGLADVVDNCIAMVQPLALERVVQLQVDASVEKVFVKADRRALDQILLNLLSNAIKYNRHGGHVRISAEARGRGRTRLMLQDSGLGMTPQQTENLFQPFNRVGAEHTRIEGTGLGLVIARELALGLGGTLEVSSVPGRGSCFTVSLPTGRASARPVPAPAPEVQQTDWIAAIGASALYIEDDPVNMALMEAIFEQLGGWQLWTAATGTEGLALALRHQPALVLTDMNLPDMTGLEIVRQLRRRPETSGMRIVAVSADAMPEQLALVKANGVDDYWTKPLDVQLIRRRLNSFLSGNPDAWIAERSNITTTASGTETLGD